MSAVAAPAAAVIGAIACPVCAAPPAPACEWHPAHVAIPACPCVVRCTGCGHRYRPTPDTALLAGAVYDRDYHDRRATRGTPGFVFKRATFALHLRTLASACGGELRDKRLLDAGCATGDFLEMAEAAGACGVGLDVSPHAAARAAARGFPTVCGRIEQVADGLYDLVHASHVLEHVPDLHAFMARVFALLRAGGLVLVEVPNEFDNLLAALPRVVGGRTRGSFDAPHLHYFGVNSLTALFRRHGFVVRRLFTYSHLRRRDAGLRRAAAVRHIHAPNAVLRLGDRLGRGRNLVLLGARPA